MTGLPTVLYQGSVKNVCGIKGKSPYVFEYSDRYSIFDWGEMPDHLEGKGQALAFMGWFFFDFLGNPKNWKDWSPPAGFRGGTLLEKLRKEGLSHHAAGLVSADLKPLTLEREIMAPSRCLAVQPVRVLHPGSSVRAKKLVWDYEAYKSKPGDALVPLEVIFRFGVPDGSSLLKRTGDPAYCRSLGLKESPKAGDVFDLPVIEFSTKLETSDRYLSYEDAREIAALTKAEFDRLKALTALAALRLKDCFTGIGVELWDGKLEFAFTPPSGSSGRGFMLVDSIGPDELRLIYKGMHLSKEVLRAHYRSTTWSAAIEKAKDLAESRGEKDWKRICTEELKSVPPMLSPVVKTRVEMIYKSLCRALSHKYLGKAVFPTAWDLDEVVKSFTKGAGP